MATFLDKLQHDKWLKEKFPTLCRQLYGFEVNVYLSQPTTMKSNYFPIIDTIHEESGSLLFRAIIKLTRNTVPEHYDFSSKDREILEFQEGITYQVLIIQVDANLDYLDSGHFPMNTLHIS